MQRSLVLASVLLLCAAIAAAFWWLRGDEAPLMPTQTPAAATSVAPAVGETSEGKADIAAEAAAQRVAVAARDAGPLDDPEIRAGLCGFKGRVVNHDKVAVADTGVRIYRGAMDSVIPTEVDFFAAESTFTPNYIAGEAKTATDGTWQVTGVWPRAIYLLFAGVGGDAPTHQIVTRVPSPGEIVDLGDIVLPHAGVITGTVLDEDGEPLAGALVRAADVPGALAAFYPFERFDPDGALLVRERGSPVKVIEMPAWVKPAFEQLPIPTTLTDAEGAFRLTGVVPGSNMLATTARSFLSDVKASVQVRAGQEKDVGKIRLKRGEELTGRVVDTAGKPVANAEVLAGSTLSVAPIDLAQRIGRSDAEGRFQAFGFSAGKVSVAARRDKGHPWVLADPQSILGEAVVTLPGAFGVDVVVKVPDGAPATQLRMQLLQGKAGDGAAEMHLLGFVPAVDLRDRKREIGEGRWRIDNLNDGPYVLLADAPGFATSFAQFEIAGADTSVALQLVPPVTFTVCVTDLEDQPIRNVAVHAEARGKRVMEMPIMCGRTGADGTLVIDKLPAQSVRVSAEHPRWGVVHGEIQAGETLHLRMQPPGSLRGMLTENGKPAPHGKYTVAVLRQRGEDANGPLEHVPALVTPDTEGAFEIKALQPGKYEATAIAALDSLRSPGGVVNLMQEMVFARSGGQTDASVTVVAGQVALVTLETGEKPIEGPTARIAGSVTVDGRVGADFIVSGWADNRRLVAKVDERGRFDLGVVPAGQVWISVSGGGEGFFMGRGSNIWSSSIEVKEGEVRELTIDVLTTSISGVCVGPDGNPISGVHVQGQGRLKGHENGTQVWVGSVTNAGGEFQFANVPEGTWTFTVRGNDEKMPMRGHLADVQAVGGVPTAGLRIDVKIAPVVKGRVDLAAVESKDAEWMWIGFSRLAANDPDDAEGDWAGGTSIDRTNGTFSSSDVGPGRYRAHLHVSLGGDKHAEYSCGVIVVSDSGVTDLVLRPVLRAPR